MKELGGVEEKEAIAFLTEAAKIALDSQCLSAKCGCVVVKDGKIIGKGFNSPPKNLENRRCLSVKGFNEKVTDKTCCVHAEQRAIIEAFAFSKDKIDNSVLYFTRLSDKNKILRVGKPYCTHCSKLALDSGIKEFVLWHEEGIKAYNTEEYNLLSY